VTNGSFAALAAEALGVSREEGLDPRTERLPALDAVDARRGGVVHFKTINKLGLGHQELLVHSSF
jgi:hypothetical protein